MADKPPGINGSAEANSSGVAKFSPGSPIRVDSLNTIAARQNAIGISSASSPWVQTPYGQIVNGAKGRRSSVATKGPFNVINASTTDGETVTMKVRVIPCSINDMFVTVDGLDNLPETDPKPTLTITESCRIGITAVVDVDTASYTPTGTMVSADATVFGPPYVMPDAANLTTCYLALADVFVTDGVITGITNFWSVGKQNALLYATPLGYAKSVFILQRL